VQLQCLVKREMWGNSTSTEYEPSDEEGKDSDRKLKLESESIVNEEMWGASCGGDDDAI